MQLEFSRQFFFKYSNIEFMKIRLVGAELFHGETRTDGRTDGRTDMTKRIAAFHNFANADSVVPDARSTGLTELAVYTQCLLTV